MEQCLEQCWRGKVLSEQQQAAQTALCLLGKANLCLSEEDWHSISQAIEALKPFEEVTREVSADKNVTLSKVIPLLSLLQRASASAGPNANILASHLAENCRRRFPSREQNSILAASTLLDPTFKNVVFSDNGNVESMRSKLIGEMQKEHASDAPVSKNLSVSVSTFSVLQASPTPSTSRLWQDFDMQVWALEGNRTVNTDAYIQMRQHMEDKVMARKEDPLGWWKKNQQSLPMLSKLAKKDLTVASSVSSQRLFSKAGELLSVKRNRLQAKNVNMLLF